MLVHGLFRHLCVCRTYWRERRTVRATDWINTLSHHYHRRRRRYGRCVAGKPLGTYETALDRPGGHCDNHSPAEQQPRHTSILACHCRAYALTKFLARLHARQRDASRYFWPLCCTHNCRTWRRSDDRTGNLRLNFAAVDYAAGLGYLTDSDLCWILWHNDRT